MKIKGLPFIIALLSAGFAHAQGTALAGADNDRVAVMSTFSEEAENAGVPAEKVAYSLPAATSLSSLASQGAAVMYISGCGAYQLGVATADIKYKDIKTKAIGLEYHIEMGLHIHYGILSDSRITSFSLQLAYMHFNAKDKYTDALNVNHENKYKFSYLGLPISYTGIFGANGALGFYFQLGANPQFLLKAKDNGTTVTSSFNKISILPFGSLGLAIPSDQSKSGNNKVRLIGPYVSSSMGNISNVTDFSFNCLNIGLRYCTFLTQ